MTKEYEHELVGAVADLILATIVGSGLHSFFIGLGFFIIIRRLNGIKNKLTIGQNKGKPE